MADSKITALTAISTVDPAADPLVIVDVSDTSMAASGTTKKITSNQILGAGGTATLASATITGDLTVDTSTLKVDSANNRVGIGTASPATILDIQSAGTLYARIQNTASTADAYLLAKNTVGEALFGINALGPYIYTGQVVPIVLTTGGSERYRVAGDGVATWSNVGGVAGTAMTLNATGLGVGTVGPVAKLEVNSASITDVDLKYNMVVRSSDAYTTSPKSGIAFAGFFNGSANIPLCGISGGKENGVLNDYGSALYFSTRPNGGSITTRLTIDSAGNVISNVTGTAPTLATNSQMVFNLTSNTNLRISVRGTDGTTRTANITLA